MEKAREEVLRRTVAGITRGGEEMWRLPRSSAEVAHHLQLDNYPEGARLAESGGRVLFRSVEDGLVEYLCPERHVWRLLIDFKYDGGDG